ncbi:serine/threonine kinase [Acanthamoeba castellanii str. Neff]|uniref:Serine/threonine kinase n=1 Tax=Acanthamoeba castellanii (strain ATCC 30010 / Neff) TaxID=1257118 RepID=L8HF31_ACACF|nr:serine/threonine kinase [Acanthamoeba castellanii str. Neff]ELR23857.1 serine/threonine kinase [Acanthamoeba castellanii str. Neff]
MDADDWTLASLMSCNGALGLVSLFLCYYYHHKKETALRVNVFFLLIATHGIVRCLFFGLSIYYSASRSARDFLDDIPGILFFSACCFFIYRAKPNAPQERSCRQYIWLLGNFYVLAIVNILFYLLYFVLLYLAFTYQDQSQRREGGGGKNDSDGEVSDSVMIVETSISALFATGYCLLAIAFGLLGIPFFCRLDRDSNAGYLEIGDTTAPIGDNTPSQTKKRKSSSTSLNNSENDVGEAAAGRRGGRTARGVPRNASDESSFIDVRFSASDDEGWSHTFDGDLGSNSLAKWRVDQVTDDELEGGHRHVGVDTAEADRFIITKKIPISGPGNGAAATAAVGHLGLQPSAKPLTCMRKSLLVVCLWLIIICFIARVTFLILSLFFETPDQYNLHTDGASGREALKIVTRFLYYLIGEVLPALLLLILHCHVIVNLRGTLNTLTRDPTIPQLECNELLMGELVGCGSFGVVHRAQWRGLDVAVKKLYLPTHMQEHETITAFTQEIALVSQLRHPNIVQFLGYTPPPALMLITEFMPHGSLTEVLRNAALQEQLNHHQLIRMARDIALGMTYLHGSSILHRDLCPSNCLVDGNLVVKIADFGLARLKSLSRTMTRGLGTPAYMAPEVLKNQPYTEKADVYSFAVCFWQLLSGEEPYKAMEGAYQIVYSVTNGDRPPLAASLGKEERALIERCWANDPQQRPAFKEVVQRLNVILSLEDDYWEADGDSDEADKERAEGGDDSHNRRPAWP